MRVLVIGGGGREHALCWRLAASPSLSQLHAMPGNPGIAQVAQCHGGDATDVASTIALAQHVGANLVVVGPEMPLMLGLVDGLQAVGIPAFGPSQAAAALEGSKVFAKELFRAAAVPTAAFEVFDDASSAHSYLARVGAPVVVKADGLCAGKGAVVCQTLAEANSAVDAMLTDGVFGAAGARIVIEECLVGPELSVFAFSDGEQIRLLGAAQDHKRIGDGDTGPNTGGMGAYSPLPQAYAPWIDEAVEKCLKPTVRAMAEQGTPYRGMLFGGFMATDQGVMTLEYNCRFGDPETQVLMPLFNGDLAATCLAVAEGRLADIDFSVAPGAAACVVMAAPGYPGSYEAGRPIYGIEDAAALPGVQVFHAGTKRQGADLVTAGGRVLGVTASGATLPSAVQRAYAAVDRISIPGAQYRRDIAARAL